MDKMLAAKLSPKIEEALIHPTVSFLLTRTLAEDFQTFKIKYPYDLAKLTIESLQKAGSEYPKAAEQLALHIYPKWNNQNVGQIYHEYNWRVERAGSANVAIPWLQGKQHIDIGGGPGTFSLEILKLNKSQNIQSVTIADIADYRNDDAKSNPNIHFQQLDPNSTPKFSDNAFDSGSLLYVLHHVERDHEIFLQEWARCIKKILILFEDVKIDTNLGNLKSVYRPERRLQSDFFRLSLNEQQLFMAANDYVCNHIASQALTMPVPAKYYEFRELTQFLKKVFPKAKVTSRYHGIYDTKCYPSPEAMYVVEFSKYESF
jgi:SAM-dependent methyltransferase